MAVYVGAVVGFAVMLYLSYRALGISPISSEQGAPMLERLCATVTSGVEEIAAGLSSETPGEVAHEGRKRLAGYEQQMARLDVDGCDPSLLSRRDRLASAVEALGWACRIAESPNYADGPALRRAVGNLSADALTLLDQVPRK